MPDDDKKGFLTAVLERVVSNLPLVGTRLMALWRLKSQTARRQVKLFFDTTSDQVREKAEETKRALQLRMAILEIEHHLNRLYPQIGKLTCDLILSGNARPYDDQDLRAKVELAQEYRQRLKELRDSQRAHHELKQVN